MSKFSLSGLSSGGDGSSILDKLNGDWFNKLKGLSLQQWITGLVVVVIGFGVIKGVLVG